MFRQWFCAFLPAPLNTRPTEWTRVAYGAAISALATTWLCSLLFGSETAAHLLGPLGASAVLLFAVSSGALAQPWSIVGSYLVATTMALLALHFVGSSIASACMAVAASMIVMCVLRCLHPPGAALTICLVLGGPAITEQGLQLFYPALFNALCLLTCALVYNNLTGLPYPRLHSPVANTLPEPELPKQWVAITAEDLDMALNEMGEFVDVSREELQHIIFATERHALRRSVGVERAEALMAGVRAE